jgi:hypothetical protein
MFYHDHAWGITRLNVYAGEAAPYIITDDTEQALIDAGTIPGPDETRSNWSSRTRPSSRMPSSSPAGRDLGHRAVGRLGQPVVAARLLAGAEPR